MNKECPKRGEKWIDDRGIACRVMSDPIEGYVVVRFKGAAPFLVHVNDWSKRFLSKLQTND